MASTVACSREHHVVSAGIEKLCGHHHLLLLARVGVWRLALIDQVEEVSLVGRRVLVADAARGADSVVAHARSSCAECTRASSISVMLRHHGHVVLVSLGRSEVVDGCSVARIALSQLGHEVAVEHGLSHLDLLVLIHIIFAAMVAARAKTANPRLIEYLILVALAIHVWKHVVDA